MPPRRSPPDRPDPTRPSPARPAQEPCMPDADVQAALAHWAPRFIQNGVDYNDFVRTVARIDTWDQWLPEWSRTADEQAGFAREADAAGHALTAGQAWRRASVDRHFGKFVWMVDLELAAEATRISVRET